MKKIFFALVTFILLTACTGKIPSNLGSTNRSLALCPDSPNCVSSLDVSDKHRVMPLDLTTADQWPMLEKQVRNLPGTRVIAFSDRYIHAEFTSRIFRFVDDLELKKSDDGQIVDVRSASRVGYFDFGVNRKRVEMLRKVLK